MFVIICSVNKMRGGKEKVMRRNKNVISEDHMKIMRGDINKRT
jgi:hypothetical protein